ncbi:hypothetical protein NN561_018102 [Cricetulus griseus]
MSQRPRRPAHPTVRGAERRPAPRASTRPKQGPGGHAHLRRPAPPPAAEDSGRGHRAPPAGSARTSPGSRAQPAPPPRKGGLYCPAAELQQARPRPDPAPSAPGLHPPASSTQVPFPPCFLACRRRV